MSTHNWKCKKKTRKIFGLPHYCNRKRPVERCKTAARSTRALGAIPGREGYRDTARLSPSGRLGHSKQRAKRGLIYSCLVPCSRYLQVKAGASHGERRKKVYVVSHSRVSKVTKRLLLITLKQCCGYPLSWKVNYIRDI